MVSSSARNADPYHHTDRPSPYRHLAEKSLEVSVLTPYLTVGSVTFFWLAFIVTHQTGEPIANA